MDTVVPFRLIVLLYDVVSGDIGADNAYDDAMENCAIKVRIVNKTNLCTYENFIELLSEFTNHILDRENRTILHKIIKDRITI